MIRVIDRANRLRYRETLDCLFRFRHEVFVRECGWTDFDQNGEYELDQYDNEKTIYFVALDDNEKVLGCFRLYPTLSPHMISEVFPHLVNGEILERRDIFEMTRFSVAKDKRRGNTYYELLAGLQEYGLKHGLLAISAVIRLFRIPVLQAAGFTVHPLGAPQEIGGEMVVAVKVDIDEESLERVRRTAGLSGSVLQDSGHALSTMIKFIRNDQSH